MLDVSGSVQIQGDLHVKGGQIRGYTDYMSIYNNTSATNSLSWIELFELRAVIGGPVIQFFTNSTSTNFGSQKMIIKSDGKVGIGTGSPDCLLHVADNTSNSDAINVPNGIRVSNIYNTAEDNIRLSALDNINTNSTSAASINALRIYSYIQKSGSGSGSGCKSEMLMGTRCDGNGGLSESRGFISYDNNFTIYKHVSPDVSTSAASKIDVATAEKHPKIGIGGTETPTAILTCHSDGNVGIGTTEPTAKLEVVGAKFNETGLKLSKTNDGSINTTTTSGTLQIYQNEDTEDAGITIMSAGYDNSHRLWKDSAGTFHISKNSDGAQYQFVQTMGGNVGIGTTSPTEKLEVNGTVKATLLDITSTSGASLIGNYRFHQDGYLQMNQKDLKIAKWQSTVTHLTVMYNTGNVGIGTTSPTSKLDVNGNVRVVGDQILLENSGRNYYLKNTDSWFRIGEGVDKYFGNGKLRTDGVLQVGEAGATLIATTGGDVGIGTTNPASALHIHEATGQGATASRGSLTISHGNSGGESSIVFPSKVNYNSDYGYISYRDDSANDGGENGMLTIGVQNDIYNTTNREFIVFKTGSIIGMQMYGISATTVNVEIQGTCEATTFNATSDIRVKTNIEIH